MLTEADGTATDFNANGTLQLPAGHQRQPNHGRIHERKAHKPDRLIGPMDRTSTTMRPGSISSVTDSDGPDARFTPTMRRIST